ncbi:MAG: hypothetical protein HY269_06340 [Deltaproteobacteria bacterium]|nr:hypothetical protein [Deltaproteobacteria bacterium]
MAASFSAPASAQTYAQFRFETALDATGYAALLTGCSADGSLRVGNVNTKGFYPYAFYWLRGTSGEVMLYGSQAYGVSTDGSYFVGSFYAGAKRFTTAAGPWTSLGTLPNQSTSFANGVNADGSIVVGGSGTAFRWTASTGMQSLGHLPGYPNGDSTALAVASDGATIIGYQTATSPPYRNMAFRWTAAEGMQPLFDPETFDWSSQANAVSADGAVIVGYAIDYSGARRAFRWKAETGPQFLQEIVLGYSGGYGVSPDGRFAFGSSKTDTNSYGLDGVIWDEQGVPHSITSLLASWGVSLPDQYLFLAVQGLSADGRTLYGEYAGREYDSWVAWLERQYPGPCPGDANNDHVVDLADLGLVLSQYGMTLPFLVGDLNLDQTVDLSDLAFVLAHFGDVCP